MMERCRKNKSKLTWQKPELIELTKSSGDVSPCCESGNSDFHTCVKIATMGGLKGDKECQ
jgi:hypothetical protein